MAHQRAVAPNKKNVPTSVLELTRRPFIINNNNNNNNTRIYIYIYIYIVHLLALIIIGLLINAIPSPFSIMYTRIRPSGESLTNYVASLYDEAGQPCPKLRSFSSCIAVLCSIFVCNLPYSALSNTKHLSIATIQFLLPFRNPTSCSVPCLLHEVVRWLTRVMKR